MKLRFYMAVLTFLCLGMWLGAAFAEGPEKELKVSMEQRHLNCILQMINMQQHMPEAQKGFLRWKLKHRERQLQQGSPALGEENPQDSLQYPVDRLAPAELPY